MDGDLDHTRLAAGRNGCVSYHQKKIISFRSEKINFPPWLLLCFYLKFKNLLIAGQSANLTFNAEAGKASVRLSLEVDVPRHVTEQPHVRISPSR